MLSACRISRAESKLKVLFIGWVEAPFQGETRCVGRHELRCCQLVAGPRIAAAACFSYVHQFDEFDVELASAFGGLGLEPFPKMGHPQNAKRREFAPFARRKAGSPTSGVWRFCLES